PERFEEHFLARPRPLLGAAPLSLADVRGGSIAWRRQIRGENHAGSGSISARGLLSAPLGPSAPFEPSEPFEPLPVSAVSRAGLLVSRSPLGAAEGAAGVSETEAAGGGAGGGSG